MAELVKVIKITPYRGPNEEIIEGRKTKISLYNDRIEYIVKYTQKVKVASTMDESIIKEVLSENEEEGFMLKNDILGVVKYIETNFKEDLEPYNVNMLDICGSGSSITFSIDTQEEKDLLYKELYDWKFSK